MRAEGPAVSERENNPEKPSEGVGIARQPLQLLTASEEIIFWLIWHHIKFSDKGTATKK